MNKEFHDVFLRHHAKIRSSDKEQRALGWIEFKNDLIESYKFGTDYTKETYDLAYNAAMFYAKKVGPGKMSMYEIEKSYCDLMHFNYIIGDFV